MIEVKIGDKVAVEIGMGDHRRVLVGRLHRVTSERLDVKIKGRVEAFELAAFAGKVTDK